MCAWCTVTGVLGTLRKRSGCGNLNGRSALYLTVKVENDGVCRFRSRGDGEPRCKRDAGEYPLRLHNFQTECAKVKVGYVEW